MTPLKYLSNFMNHTKIKLLSNVPKHPLIVLRTASTAENHQSNVENHESNVDMFISDIKNPYEPKKRVCILCKYNLTLDYKNAKLLSQFISPYTGFIYDKHITGLCDTQQRRLVTAVRKARYLAYMAVEIKAAKYLKDPKLFDPFSPSRPHPH